MPKFIIQSLKCQYVLICVLRLGYSSDISLYGNGEVGDCGWMEYIRAYSVDAAWMHYYLLQAAWGSRLSVYIVNFRLTPGV